MIVLLRTLFTLILVAMLAVTGWAGSKRNLFEAGGELLRNPWGVATLFDTYFAFLTFYLWVAYKERSIVARIVWFVLIMGLGKIAMAVYMLLQLFGMPATGSAKQLLLRKNET